MGDYRTIREILELSPSQRKSLFQVSGLENKHIDRVTIDGIHFNDYSAFTFLMESAFVTSPARSSNGSMPDMDTYPWFLTPHIKIDFSLMSIEAYRQIMKLLRSKKEFVVTCYDIVDDKDVTHKMYFATEQMPKLWSIAKALNGGKPWVELLGVQDYTVELIGTNNDYEKSNITYYLNAPSGVSWSGDVSATEEAATRYTTNIGISIWDGTTNDKGDKNTQYIANMTLKTLIGKTYKFKYWCENSDGSGFKYMDGNEYLITQDIKLYAIWQASAT